jgi:hypothetical protein
MKADDANELKEELRGENARLSTFALSSRPKFN